MMTEGDYEEAAKYGSVDAIVEAMGNEGYKATLGDWKWISLWKRRRSLRIEYSMNAWVKASEGDYVVCSPWRSRCATANALLVLRVQAKIKQVIVSNDTKNMMRFNVASLFDPPQRHASDEMG